MNDTAKKLVPAIAIALVPTLFLTLIFAVVFLAAVTSCGAGSAGRVDPTSISAVNIDGYEGDQLVNAAHVMNAAADKGLSLRDQTIGVMTAVGESSLVNIAYGDWETGGVTNPDGSPTTSIGLFQQQAGWGTVAERMDPYVSAGKFFDAMIQNVPDAERQTLEPTIVAHRVQSNQDPYHYEVYWPTSEKIVAALAGANAGKAQSCNALVPGGVNRLGWAAPSAGPLTDTFGPRAPVWTGSGYTSGFHRGVDLDPGCDAPIWAVQSGTVIMSGFDGFDNGTIQIDHGAGVTSRYLHMYASGMLVRAGDSVQGGQQIAKVGASGQSIGCHLHFELRVNGEAVDPIAFMAEVGITLG